MSCHESVREALVSRLQVLLESGLFYDETNPLTEEKILSRHRRRRNPRCQSEESEPPRPEDNRRDIPR